MGKPSLKDSVLRDLSLIDDMPNPESKLFGFDDYAKQLSDVLINPQTKTPYSIMIHGEWGSGKSTLLEKTKRIVDEKIKDRKGWNTLWFDAWAYEKLDPTTALINMITEKFENNVKFKEITKGLGLFLSDIALRSTTGISVNEFRNYFNSALKSIKTISQELESMVGENRLIVFIDDLDRCMIDNVLNIMEAVKLFLNAKGMMFIFAVDKQKIERAWELRYKNEVGTIEGKEHIGKIFQLRLSLPPKHEYDIDNYVKDIAPSLLPNIHELIVKGCHRNPRKIKRIINTVYFLSLSIKQENFKINFPMIVIWSILANEFPEIGKIIKEEQNTMVQIALFCSLLPNYEFLLDKIQEMRPFKTERRNTTFRNGEVFSHSQIYPSTITALELIANGRKDIFTFFKALALFLDLKITQPKDTKVDLERMYKDHTSLLTNIIYDSGLIDVN